MKMVKRWGVMTLVALLVLGTMGAALADDDVDATETETAKETLVPGVYGPELMGRTVLEWVDGLVQFVFYWGYDDKVLRTEDGPECPSSDVGDSTGLFGLFGSNSARAEVGDCVFLDVERNGHVNHGSMVSSVVHWLQELKTASRKVEATPELEDLRDMPKGQS